MNYSNFLRRNWRFLSFGISLNFFSSTGQTFFISIFGGEFRRDFNLSEGEFGFIYMIATLLSAGSLIWIGRLIDRMDLRIYTLLVCLGSILASFLTSIVILVLFYNALKPKEKLAIYQPSMVNYELVDSTLQHKKKFHRLIGCILI